MSPARFSRRFFPDSAEHAGGTAGIDPPDPIIVHRHG